MPLATASIRNNKPESQPEINGNPSSNSTLLAVCLSLEYGNPPGTIKGCCNGGCTGFEEAKGASKGRYDYHRGLARHSGDGEIEMVSGRYIYFECIFYLRYHLKTSFL